MDQVLQAGALAAGPAHYVHTGDLRWWLFYGPPLSDLRQHTALWDDPDQPGRCLGWMLVEPEWLSFEAFLQPDLLGTPFWSSALEWAEDEALAAATSAGTSQSGAMLHKLWVGAEDALLIAHLERRGFHAARWDWAFKKDLLDGIAAPGLPDGFHLRLCRGPDELTARAEAQYQAFDNRMPFEKYLARFETFMRSQAYAVALDLVAVAQEGRIASFCFAWLDRVTREGHFEPVGTHPAFRRLGLGKAVLLDALARMRAAGMERASVATPEENTPACALYRSAGFQAARRLGCFERRIGNTPDAA